MKSLKSLGWGFNHSRLLVSITANQQNSSDRSSLAEVFFGRFEAMFALCVGPVSCGPSPLLNTRCYCSAGKLHLG